MCIIQIASKWMHHFHNENATKGIGHSLLKGLNSLDSFDFSRTGVTTYFNLPQSLAIIHHCPYSPLFSTSSYLTFTQAQAILWLPQPPVQGRPSRENSLREVGFDVIYEPRKSHTVHLKPSWLEKNAILSNYHRGIRASPINATAINLERPSHSGKGRFPRTRKRESQRQSWNATCCHLKLIDIFLHVNLGITAEKELPAVQRWLHYRYPTLQPVSLFQQVKVSWREKG